MTERSSSTSPIAPRVVAWVLAATWMLLAVCMGLALNGATGHGAAVARILPPTVWWAAVAAVVLALVVPSPLGLTAMRMIVPASAPAAVLVWTQGASATWGALSVAFAIAATFLALSGEVGQVLAQGSAYGHEQRFPLRPPAPVLPPMVLSWLVWCASLLAGVALLSERRWLAGVAVTALAGALTWALAARFHRLSSRWLVLVPAGLVVRDQMVLGETLMVQRNNVTTARLAMADTEAADLTGPAAGHALEVGVREMVLAVFPATNDHPTGRAIHLQSFLVAPTRPGRALQSMADAHLPVG